MKTNKLKRIYEGLIDDYFAKPSSISSQEQQRSEMERLERKCHNLCLLLIGYPVTFTKTDKALQRIYRLLEEGDETTRQVMFNCLEEAIMQNGIEYGEIANTSGITVDGWSVSDGYRYTSTINEDNSWSLRDYFKWGAYTEAYNDYTKRLNIVDIFKMNDRELAVFSYVRKKYQIDPLRIYCTFPASDEDTFIFDIGVIKKLFQDCKLNHLILKNVQLSSEQNDKLKAIKAIIELSQAKKITFELSKWFFYERVFTEPSIFAKHLSSLFRDSQVQHIHITDNHDALAAWPDDIWSTAPLIDWTLQKHYFSHNFGAERCQKTLRSTNVGQQNVNLKLC